MSALATAKLRRWNIFRSTIGFSCCSSQKTNDTSDTADTIVKPMMAEEWNQSSSWPLSRTYSRQPRPGAMSPRPEPVDAARAVLLRPLEVRRVRHDAVREDQRRDADGDVDEEHPAPGEVVGDEAAERRPDRGREDDGHAVDGHRHAALRRREGVGQDGLLARAEAAAADALQDAEEDERAERRRDAAQERRDGEERHAAHVEPLAPDPRRQPPADGEDHGVRDEVAREHPRALVLADAQVAGDVRQRHVRDARVEHLHERRHGDDQGDGPRVPAPGPSGGEVRRGLCRSGARGGRRGAHRTLTCGSTLMPMRSRSMPGCPGSRRMRTGMRWTTFT